jgi:DNA-binding NarL/FixJ family response regulator
MGLHVLIAEPREITRTGLRTIFSGNALVDRVYEAATSEDLQKYLETHSLDLLVIHQSLVTDIETLPRGHFVLLASQPDKGMFLAALDYGACGYLLENASVDLVRKMLDLIDEAFVVDMALTSWIRECIQGDTLPSAADEILTPREQEIFNLVHKGLTNRAIAQQLYISESTVKTHVGHIRRKLHITRLPAKELPL